MECAGAVELVQNTARGITGEMAGVLASTEVVPQGPFPDTMEHTLVFFEGINVVKRARTGGAEVASTDERPWARVVHACGLLGLPIQADAGTCSNDMLPICLWNVLLLRLPCRSLVACCALAASLRRLGGPISFQMPSVFFLTGEKHRCN